MRHVAGGHFLHLLGEGIAVLVNFLHRHRAENRAQMTFERLHGDVFDVIDALAQKLFRRRGDGNVVALDLDLRHAVHLHRHAFAGVNFRRLHINRQQFERKHVHLFDDGQTNVPPPLTTRKPTSARVPSASDDRVFAAGNDEHLVRADLGVAARPDDGENEEDEQERAGAENDRHPGNVTASARMGDRFMC